MTFEEVKSQVAFELGIPLNENVEYQSIDTAILVSFRELQRYMRTPVDKTVPFSTRIKLDDVGIETVNVLNVIPSTPRVGLMLGSIDSANVFQLAAASNQNFAGQTSSSNIQPLLTEMAMAQVRNTISTDFQWKYDALNGVVYVTHRPPVPATVTIIYVPIMKDVSEIKNFTWIDYLIRLAIAHMKVSLGRSRSKYTIQGSNVTLDGDVLLNEGNQELTTLREELDGKQSKLIVLT